MYGLKFLISRLRCERMHRSLTRIVCPINHKKMQLMQIRSYVSRRIVSRPIEASANNENGDGSNWPRKIFSGIQPTGALHIGNYLGAVRKWRQLQEAHEDVTYCIVDMHSITLPQDPVVLRENIFKIAAAMLACGIDPNQSKLFVQSAVKEHSELCWLLGTLCTMARLGHLPQYKEKTRQLRDIPLGLFVYPILQAADIMLYKSTHIPVGEDQIQHIQLAQHLAKTFNSRYGDTFPICHAMIEDKQVSRIRSLRDPTKKMSKSDPDQKSAIYITDEPDIVLEKVKKAVTDFCSDVSYDTEGRPGVSNLIAIHSSLSGQSIESIIAEARSLDTGKYKLRVAEAINEHLKPIREKIKEHLENRNELTTQLENGAEKARNIAFDTIEEVKHRMGLGAPYLPLYLDTLRPNRSANIDIENKPAATTAFGSTMTQAQAQATATSASAKPSSPKSPILEAKLATLEVSRKLSAIQKPEVPQQRLRIEKTLNKKVITMPMGKPINIISDITKGLLEKGLLKKSTENNYDEYHRPPQPILGELPKIRRVARCNEVKPPRTIVPPIVSPPPITASTAAAAAVATDTIIAAAETIAFADAATTSDINIQQKTTNETNEDFENIIVNDVPPPPQLATEESLPLSPSLPEETAPSPPPTQLESTTSVTPSSSAITALSQPKTTLPAICTTDIADTADTVVVPNGERSTTQNIQQLTTTETTKTATKHNQMTTVTPIRNFITTSSIAQCHRKDPCKKENSLPKQKSQSNRNYFERTLLYGVLALGAGFGAVYYFCRSILQAYFDKKKSDGGL